MDEFVLAPRTTPLGTLDFTDTATWYKGPYCHKFPFNRGIQVEDVLLGWKPARKLISRDTKVMAFGSCFAEYFIRFLAKHNYNRWQLPDDRHAPCDVNLLIAINAYFENLLVVVQHIRWAFGEFTPGAKLWFTKDKTHFEATEERRAKARRGFEEGQVFIVTLGLSEVWFDVAANEPMWRTIPSHLYEPGRHVCRRTTMAETLAAFREFDRLADLYMPGKSFVFTISPVPLFATFRNQSAVTANQVSKAVLRAALDEFITDEKIHSKGRYYYFPSYELVLNLFPDPFGPDKRHVRPDVAQTVMEIFSSEYTDLPPKPLSLANPDTHIAWLESRVRTLEREAAEKEQVIRELDKAARERLALIEQLSGGK